MSVTSPLAPKLRSSCREGSSEPLPETVFWTTPLVAVTKRSRAVAERSPGERDTALLQGGLQLLEARRITARPVGWWLTVRPGRRLTVGRALAVAPPDRRRDPMLGE